MQFRTDIAGLRAVAIVPILLLHAGVTALPGGFVGVDVFFVISGFLITSILEREFEAKRFTLLGFYRRRAVRILPALLVMLAVTLAAGCVLLFPSDLRALGQSSAAAAASGSNILFWRTASYFTDVPELRPLLHTWSLGVEEQFYLFYPLLLVLLRHFARKWLKLVLAIIAVGSFAGAWYFATRSVMLPFYMLPFRAWELALGGLVALGGFPALANPRLREAIAFAGLAMVAAALFVIDAQSSFPAPWGLLPCLGTALLIAYGERGFTARLLSLPPMQWIGAISYSLYLWHWPILSLWRYRFGVALEPWEIALTVALALAAATLSYRWIELPPLGRYRNADPRRVVAVAAIAMAAMAALGLAVAANANRIRRADPATARVLAYADYPDSAEHRFQFRTGTCYVTTGAETFDARQCLAFADAKPNVLLIGDSLAAHLARALAERHPEANVMQATASGCFPFIGGTGDPACVEIMNRALGPVLDEHRPDRVILSAYWFKRADDLAPLFATIRAIGRRGIPVTVVGVVPEFRDGMPRLAARALAHHDRSIVDEAADPAALALDRRLAAQVRAAGADYAEVYDAQCPAGHCRILAPDGGPMVFDEHHWTLSGSRAMLALQPIF